MSEQTMPSGRRIESHASFRGASGWLDSPALSGADLRGKVIVVSFWTFSCVNWLRTEPYIQAWADKYRDQGLVVIGVHTPNSASRSDWRTCGGRPATTASPHVALDSDYAVWRASGNNYWPAHYFIDAEGRVREHHYGEGDYERSEAIIQELLKGPGAAVSIRHRFSRGRRAGSCRRLSEVRSPESYVGAAKAENFASPGGAVAASPANTRFRSGCDSIIGLSRDAGKWATKRSCSTARPAGSPTASTHATRIW